MPQIQNHAISRPRFRIIIFFFGTITASYFLLKLWNMRHFNHVLVAATTTFGVIHGNSQSSSTSQCPSAPPTDLNWYPPNSTMINNLSTVINGTGVYGYIFNSSTTPSNVPYSTYNWCNMPHARAQEYIIPPSEYKLAYVEVIHRHHKRTPYQSNTFPIEAYPWLCDDESLYYFGAPYPSNEAAQVAWSIRQAASNPFKPSGFPNSTCQFPQITAGGLNDSRQHGSDLFALYHDTLHFLPAAFNASQVEFRVTNNVITSQVLAQVVVGMYPSASSQRLAALVQPTGVDSLEPQYTCTAASSAYALYGVGSNVSASPWRTHLAQSAGLFAALDGVSGVNASDPAWHSWFDHYFDNLSAKLCHAKPLPCSLGNASACVTPQRAHDVFRRGLWEYSYIYRDASASLAASAASYGVYVAELAANLRAAMAGPGVGAGGVFYRHNVGHDGGLARLLSILQVDVMVWPGMGSEVVFELWKRQAGSGGAWCWYVRVLWKGEVLRSSNPSLGRMDLIPVQVLLNYIDGLVGVNAVKVPGLCSAKS